MPVLVQKVLPLIDHQIERDFERLNFNLKSKISVPKFKDMINEINTTLLTKIFQYIQEDSSSESEDEQTESDEEDEFSYINRKKEKKIGKI